ncbi:MAG TPA: LuxR C-terminal-related transcriptional regulator [Gaiellaceae bacterium]|nr:LuxR C-terminal-related transcriptional regulator [Gaiellaceae bacterium]
MPELRQRDVSAALALVAELGAADEPEDVAARTLPALRALLGADAASFSGGARDGGAVWRFDPEDALEPVGDDELEARVAGHPVVSRMLRTGDGRAARVSDVVSQRRFEQLPIYRDRFRPTGLRYQLLTGIALTPPLPSGIGVARVGSDFGERERVLLELLRRPLATVFRNTLARVAARRLEVDAARAEALGLTGREIEVVGHVARGLADQAIARELSISVRTVEKHLEHAYRKLGVAGRRDAVARVCG